MAAMCNRLRPRMINDQSDLIDKNVSTAFPRQMTSAVQCRTAQNRIVYMPAVRGFMLPGLMPLCDQAGSPPSPDGAAAAASEASEVSAGWPSAGFSRTTHTLIWHFKSPAN